MKVLDVGTGTGLLAREIAQLVGTSGIVGVDPSRSMLTAGRRNLGAVKFIEGVGEHLPIKDGSFDFVTMGYALRHVADLHQAFGEYLRVLKPDGRLLLLEITRPVSSLGLALARVYFGSLVPVVTRLATGSAEAAALMRFYWDTIQMCVPPETVIQALQQAGFGHVQRTVAYGIFSEYTGLRRT